MIGSQRHEQPFTQVEQGPARNSSWSIPAFLDNDNFWYLLLLFIVSGTLAIGAFGGVLFPDYAQFLVIAPVALVLGLVMLVRPEVAMLITVIYIPFDNWDVFALPGGLSISKVLGLLLLGTFAFNIVLRQIRFRAFDDPQDFTIVMFAGVLLLSGVASEFQFVTFSEVDRMLRIMAFYLAVKNLLSSPYIIQITMWGLLFTVAYASGWGINEYYVAQATRIHDIRVGGINMNPNDYAAIAVVGLWLGIHLLEITRHLVGRVAAVIAVALIMYGILLSGSRGAMLAVAVTGVFYIWQHPRRNILFVTTIAALLISFPLWPESIQLRITGEDDALSQSVYTQTLDHSTDRRMSYQTFGLDLLAQNPLLGTGHRTFSRLYPSSEFAQIDNPMEGNQHFRIAHNAYLEVASGSGLLGLFFYLMILLFSWFALFRVKQQFKRGTLFWGAASAFELALISLAITSLFLSIEHFQMTWFVIAMSSALAFQLRTLPPKYIEDLKTGR